MADECWSLLTLVRPFHLLFPNSGEQTQVRLSPTGLLWSSSNPLEAFDADSGVTPGRSQPRSVSVVSSPSGPVSRGVSVVVGGRTVPGDRVGDHDWRIAEASIRRCSAELGQGTWRWRSSLHAFVPQNSKTYVPSTRAMIRCLVGERATCEPGGGNPNAEVSFFDLNAQLSQTTFITPKLVNRRTSIPSCSI